MGPSKTGLRDDGKQFRCDDVVLGCEWVARNDDEGRAVPGDPVTRTRRARHGRGPAEVVEQIHRVITEV
jgi:Protein of unknown function (DUF1059)